MRRRRFVEGVGLAVGGLAGCLDTVGAPETVTTKPPSGGNWPLARFDAANTAAAPAENAPDTFPLDRRWSADTGQSGVHVPVVADGSVYATAGHPDGAVLALSAADGEERWRVVRDQLIDAAPAIVGDDVIAGYSYAPTYRRLVALSERDGDVQWEEQLSSSPSSNPVAADGAIFLGRGGGDAHVETFTRDGEHRFGTPIPEPSHAVTGVAAAGERVYATGYGFATDYPDVGHAIALDRDGGERRWRTETEFPARSVAVAGGTAYVATDGRVLALDADDGEERWRHRGGDGLPIAVGDDTVYVAGNGSAVALSAADGSELWRTDVDAVGLAPVVAGGTVFLAGERYDPSGLVVIALTTAEGAERWQTAIEGASATGVSVADGKLLLGTDGGEVLAFG